jgi:hypothetical protein
MKGELRPPPAGGSTPLSGGHTGRAAPEGPRALRGPKEVVLKKFGNINVTE